MARTKIHDFLDEIAKRNGITEVIINRPDNVFVEKDGELIKLETRFKDEDIEGFCQEVAQYNRKAFSPQTPILDGNLPDGSRINLIHKDYTNSHHAITIRKYLKNIKNFADAPGIFGLDADWVYFLQMLVKSRMNVIVSGGTGVGKTTFLNLLLQEIDPKERIITIEDTRELQFTHANTVRLEARPPVEKIQGLSIRDLLKNTLRMRPDRIIVGEVRGGEVFDLLQAMNTGHEGSMTSVHANSPAECLLRLENLYMLAGYELPLRALRYQISSAVDYIIQIKRNKTGERIISQVTEIAGMEGDRILMQDIGLNKETEMGLEFTGLVPSNMPKLQQAGLAKEFFNA
jgi:pilus assembly protein CpaF